MQKRFPPILPPSRPREQRAHRGLNVKRAFDQPLDAIGDRHVDAPFARQLGQRERAELALGEAARSRFGRACAASERQSQKRSCAIAARSRSERDRRAPKGPSASTPRAPKASPKRRSSAKPRAVSAATALAPKPAAGGDAAGDRQHVLCRAADLDPANVGRMIKPQSRPAQRIAERARQLFIARRERHRGRQARGDVGGEGGSGENGPRSVGRGFSQDLGHERVRAALDALGASDKRR